MSDVLQGALASGTFGLLVLVCTRYFTIQDRKQENEARFKERNQEIEAKERERRDDAREWYRHELFHKRLEAIQQANYQLGLVSGRLGAAMTNGADAELVNRAREASSWLSAHYFYIYGDHPTQSALNGFFIAAANMGSGTPGPAGSVSTLQGGAAEEIASLGKTLMKDGLDA